MAEDSFNQCDVIRSSYEIISNNASNKYGTCTILRNDFEASNIKMDTNGRIIIFDLNNLTFGNVYLPSGNDQVSRSNREEYFSRIIPQLLVNSKDSGSIGGDWNCIVDNNDATNNPSSKKSPSLKRPIKIFQWKDSYRIKHPATKTYSRYFSNDQQGDGATRIDRSYHFGDINIFRAEYVGIAFSDHLAYLVTIKVPESFAKLNCPRSKPLFKAKPEVIADATFRIRLKESFSKWLQVREFGLDTLIWWEIIVKPGIKKLLLQRGKEINRERSGEINFLQMVQSYLIRKIQSGQVNRLAELKGVQMEIELWHEKECEKIKLMSKAEEVDKHESVRIYHHELHQNRLKNPQ